MLTELAHRRVCTDDKGRLAFLWLVPRKGGVQTDAYGLVGEQTNAGGGEADWEGRGVVKAHVFRELHYRVGIRVSNV